jgi:hypothetical protein
VWYFCYCGAGKSLPRVANHEGVLGFGGVAKGVLPSHSRWFNQHNMFSDDIIECPKLTSICRTHHGVAEHPCLGFTPLVPDSKASHKPRSVFVSLLILYTLLCFTTMLILTVLRLAFSFIVLATATPSYNARPFAASLENRQSQNINGGLQVDLGYDVYQGVANTSTGLNTWKGYAVRPFLKELRLTFTVFALRPLPLGLYVGKPHNHRR